MSTENTEAPVTAITGKPLTDYEPFVDLLSHVMANGIALATDRDFLLSLDQSQLLHEAVREHARESIRWRFAAHIDEIMPSVASRGAGLIEKERARQITDEGHTTEGDRNQGDLLARAGIEYANVAVAVLRSGPEAAHFDPPLRWNWPWSNEFWKPSEDPIRDLTKAGALIAAAIDSLIEAGY
ncbi:hypothetical protein [Microbacterium sp. R1]|uniref:hypothetical protein n=1 Tax=Microbacterium sp. R1 TaxID=322686 RepID=UPI001D12BD21|nr:hypothetical protein [Microbacterium sp. R1]